MIVQETRLTLQEHDDDDDDGDDDDEKCDSKTHCIISVSMAKLIGCRNSIIIFA